MRIALVVPGFVEDREEPGLAAVVDLVERLAAIHDVEIVALRHPPTRRPYRIAGATVRPLGYGPGGGPLGRSVVLAWGIRAVLRVHRRRPIDLVHGLWADEAGAVAAVAARLARRPSLVSFMGGELTGLADIGYGAALGRGGRWTVAASIRLADGLSAGSGQVREAVLARRPRAAVTLLPLGVDLALFRPAEVSRPAEARADLLFAGSLEPVKDPAAALDVTAALTTDRPGLRLTVAGDGRLRARLEAQARGLGIADRVAFVGRLPRARLAEAYRASSLLLVTSRHEAQSMVAVEAAASGVPVVGTRVGVLPDLGEGALTAPVGDERALVAAAATVLDDAALAARMGAAGRVVATERFDIDRTAAEVLAAYDALVSRGGGGARRS